MFPLEEILKKGGPYDSEYRTIFINDDRTLDQVFHFNEKTLSFLRHYEYITVECETGKIVAEHFGFRVVMRLLAGESPLTTWNGPENFISGY